MRCTGRGCAVCVVFPVLLLLPAALVSAEGILVDRPVKRSGIEIFPRRVAPFFAARYDFDGSEVRVYFTESEVELPAQLSARACGGESLLTMEDPGLSVRLLELEGDLVVFVYDEREVGSEFSMCGYIAHFVDRYRFFRSAFPDDPGARLPAIVESE